MSQDSKPSLRVGTGVAGRGVFAIEAIPRGAKLLDYSGPILTYSQTTPQTLAVQIGPDRYLGASGEMDDFVNHSCDPNAGLVIDEAAVTLFAIRDIAACEEIYFDYSTTMNEDDFEMPCHCGSARCRKLVRDFKHLEPALKRRYAELGIVPEYNLRYV
jgi:uncharacterized protein